MVQNVFRSGFLVRVAHTLLTWIITVILFLHNTSLRRCEEQGELLLPALFFLLVVLSVLLYFAVSLMDPGFVLNDTVKGAQSPNEEMEAMIPQSSTPRLRRCGYCLLQVTSCCQLLPAAKFQCSPIYSCCVISLCFRSGISPALTWEQWFRVNGFLLAALCIVGIFSVVVVVLLGSHLYLISINCTTWEFMSRHRISYLKTCKDEENPFDRGVLCNLWDFFCICRTVMWEKVYHRNTLNPV
ncbi:probable palmitoyltransferase ZDHHC12 [Neolamprologus brichardi]|uniref:protein S-acyltransferase n=1 Tax=Neolamprologus brichardi TaxID=32507 RepID=A0A3Q4HKD4_NEOBR|nr:probable palmitoyltransferase ZDHHC12 [Neolamprologus brichardi]